MHVGAGRRQVHDPVLMPGPPRRASLTPPALMQEGSGRLSLGTHPTLSTTHRHAFDVEHAIQAVLRASDAGGVGGPDVLALANHDVILVLHAPGTMCVDLLRNQLPYWRMGGQWGLGRAGRQRGLGVLW